MSLSRIHIFQQPLEGILEEKAFLKKNRVPILHDRMNFTISFSNIRGKGWRKIYGNVLSISLRVRCYTSSYVCRAMLFHILREYNRSLFKVKFQLQVGKALYRCSCYIILLSCYIIYLPKVKFE